MILYTDIDHFCCNWLRNLEGEMLPRGSVIEADVIKLSPRFLNNFTQCHFFCGIGGWPIALQLYGWPLEFPIWTGSCPCQPFSMSGKQANYADSRDTWPDWFYLISKCRPPIIFGEQVSGPLGKDWLRQAHNDLETVGYRVAAGIIPASSLGALHERSRIFWVAHSSSARLEGFESARSRLCISTSPSPTECANDCILARVQNRPDPESVMFFDGISRPVDIVRALGNAIVPQIAAEFITLSMEAILEG